jgi:hypothetical protein
MQNRLRKRHLKKEDAGLGGGIGIEPLAALLNLAYSLLSFSSLP